MDQDPQDVPELRENWALQDPRGPWENWDLKDLRAPPEDVVSVAPKVPLVLQVAEVLRAPGDRRVVTVWQGEPDPRDLTDLQVPRVLLEIRVQPGPGGTRARTGSQVPLERKEPWAPPGPDCEDQMERKAWRVAVETEVVRDPAVPLVHVVSRDGQGPLVLLDPRGPPGSLGAEAAAWRAPGATGVPQVARDPKVLLVLQVLLVLLVQDSEETKGGKEPRDPRGPVEVRVRAAPQADRAQKEPREHQDLRATWGNSGHEDLLV